MTGFLVAGTSSDAGKSLVVTGLCRLARRRGIDVVPYKAQNMSNNSMVCPDGSEIGRAQYLQSIGAGVEASALMNPVLLKPGSDRSAFVVVRGQPAGTLEAGEYATDRRQLAEAAWSAHRELADAHELVICEGAGSPAEINLRSGDYTNMGLARRFDLPVVLVGDIDRGGVLASIFGTWALLDAEDRRLMAGYLINKFRGDQSVLDPGLAEISRRTGLANLGVLPWIRGAWLDGEDSLDLGRWRDESVNRRIPGQPTPLRVAALAFPRISNATDLDALAQEPGVDVILTSDPAEILAADLAVLPGSRSTTSDLAWLRSRGLDDAITMRAERGLPVLGICGGFQMLARHIEDGVESEGHHAALGLLPADVTFHPDKVLRRASGQWRGHPVDGYEIHHGRCAVDADAEEFLGGVHVGSVWGTMWHGSLESDNFRRAWLTSIAALAGRDWTPDPAARGFAERREHMINGIADAIEQAVDVDALLALAR